jgi:drug/metabolite transporter (DMT)-like permease
LINSEKSNSLTRKIPGKTYLWLAILIFGASSAVTQKITVIGAHHFIGGRNPISLCNVLFVGNLCALLVLMPLYRHQLSWTTLKRLTKQQWSGLILEACLAGALAPGLIFQALSLTSVNNIVLVGRLEPPLILVLSVWLLGERVNAWQVVGAITAFIGVTLTLVLQSPVSGMINVRGFHLGSGELMAAAGAAALAFSTIIGRKRLYHVSLGFSSIFRTALGTVIFFFLALALYGNQHFMGVFSPFLWEWMLLYGAVIVVVGQSFWAVGLRSTPLSEASLVASFTPIIGILAAYLVLGEDPTQAQYIGGSVILLSIVLSQIGIHGKPSPSLVVTGESSMSMERALESRIGFKGI